MLTQVFRVTAEVRQICRAHKKGADSLAIGARSHHRVLRTDYFSSIIFRPMRPSGDVSTYIYNPEVNPVPSKDTT